MKTRLLILALPLMISQVSQASAPYCGDVLASAVVASPKATLADAKELSLQAHAKIAVIPEFAYIRAEAEKRGLRVWLFGGTASSYLHYVKWDLARAKGLKELQQDRFDYDFTNIFRSTQDLDIVVDGSPQAALELQKVIAAKFPHFLGSKAAKWEVRTLRARMGTPGQGEFKEALLGDPDFINQNTDSNSLGMVEVTTSTEPVVRDLRHWDDGQSVFLEDTLNNRISFLRSDKHFTSARAKAGENPEILSVIRVLVKAFQYELNFSDKDFAEMKSIVDHFDITQVNNANALRRIEDTAKKLVMHAVNIEYAMNKMDELGLRKKLIQAKDVGLQQSASWWLNKEPLRSKSVGQGAGKTAQELGLQIVAHETTNFLAYESITRAHSGEPNVLISRDGKAGELAAHGDGFYTRNGRTGARGTGLTIRFNVDPQAREGSDFTRFGEYILFQNKKALKVIQESLNLTMDDLLQMAESNQFLTVDKADLGLLEKLRRKINAPKITEELNKLMRSKSAKDQVRLVRFLSALQHPLFEQILGKGTLIDVTKAIYSQVKELYNSPNDEDVLRYFQIAGPMAPSLQKYGMLMGGAFRGQYNMILAGGQPRGAKLMRAAAFENIFESPLHEIGLRIQDFEKRGITGMGAEIRRWRYSKDLRKRNLYQKIEAAGVAAFGDIQEYSSILQTGVIDINDLNVSGQPLIFTADYLGKKAFVEWMLQQPELNLEARNKDGDNVIEQALLQGQTELAQAMRTARPQVAVRAMDIKERHDNGAPIMAFVRMEPRPFIMNVGQDNFIAEPESSFDIFSVNTTVAVWREVARWGSAYFLNKYTPMNPNGDVPAEAPVHMVDPQHIEDWLQALNHLSKDQDPRVQDILKNLFPKHQVGDVYRLPTDVELQFVQRRQGLATGSHWWGDSLFSDSAGRVSTGSSQPVGSKKPLFIHGQPLYDLEGGVSQLAVEKSSGTFVAQGRPGARSLTAISERFTVPKGYTSPDLGFRLVREVRNQTK